MKKLMILLAISLLAGCATTAQREADRIVEARNEAEKISAACIKKLQAYPEFAAMDKIFIMDVEAGGKIRKLAINRYLTQQEADELIRFADLRMPCRKKIADAYSRADPQYGLIFVELFSGADADTVQLIQNKMTIGEANQRTVDRVNRLVQEYHQVSNNLADRLEYSHNQQVAQRQRAAAAFQQWNQNQQMINSMNRPRTTNCYALGNSVNCNTY